MPRERPRGRMSPSLGPSSWTGSTETTGCSKGTCQGKTVQNGSKRMVTSDLLVWQPAGPNSFSGAACRHGSGQAVLHSFFSKGRKRAGADLPKSRKEKSCHLARLRPWRRLPEGSRERREGERARPSGSPSQGTTGRKEALGKRKEEKNMKEARARSPA